jgi:hypothetical protein
MTSDEREGLNGALVTDCSRQVGESKELLHRNDRVLVEGGSEDIVDVIAMLFKPDF